MGSLLLPQKGQAGGLVLGKASEELEPSESIEVQKHQSALALQQLRCSFFSHARDNQPKVWSGAWEQLKAILERSYQPGSPGDKRTMPAISPAFYLPGAIRSRDNVQGVHLLLLDFDNTCEEAIPGEFYPDPRTGAPSNRPRRRKIRVENPVSMPAVLVALERARVTAMAWTTYSCSPEHEKFRVLVPMVAPVPVEAWESASELALQNLGLEPFRRGLDVPVLHNPAALAFLPGSPDPKSIRRGETKGELFLPSWEMPSIGYFTSLPRDPERAAERQMKWERGDQWWAAYRVHGHPVDFQNLDLTALLEARGIKVGQSRPFKDGTKRRCHCPWAQEHSSGIDDDAAVIIHTPGTWPSFKCLHSGHAHMGLRDLIEWAWGRP